MTVSKASRFGLSERVYSKPYSSVLAVPRALGSATTSTHLVHSDGRLLVRCRKVDARDDGAGLFARLRAVVNDACGEVMSGCDSAVAVATITGAVAIAIAQLGFRSHAGGVCHAAGSERSRRDVGN